MTSYTEGFSHFVTSMTAPVASGWSDLAVWDSHPLESAALSRGTRQSVIQIANSPAHGPSLRQAEASPAFWFDKVAAAACYSQIR